MKKSEQLEINREVMNTIDRYNEELNHDCLIGEPKRLRNCQAYVYEIPSFYILRSYNTIIAVIDKSTDTCYDFLRLVYGYTATSAKHISNFDKDYGKDTWGCRRRLTYREV